LGSAARGAGWKPARIHPLDQVTYRHRSALQPTPAGTHGGRGSMAAARQTMRHGRSR